MQCFLCSSQAVLQQSIHEWKGCVKAHSDLMQPSLHPMWLTHRSISDCYRLSSYTELWYLYKVCSESNASYFMMLAHDVRGGCWWCGSRGWTFLSMSHYVLLPCDSWQQRGSLTGWCPTRKCVWSKGVSLNSCMQKKWQPMAFIDTWRPKSGYEHHEVMGGVFQQW